MDCGLRTDPISETNGATTAVASIAPDVTRRFIEAYGQPGGVAANTPLGQPDTPKIPLPYGMMAVTLCAKFNDSAPQVDHFNYHARFGCPDFALLIVPKQAKTERLARQALSLCPDLAVGIGLEWTWKSETWSMGHGNYLQSSAFELPPELSQGVRFTFPQPPQPFHAFWEIEFTTNLREGQLVELWPHKNFKPFPQPSTLNPQRGRPTASVILNTAKSGVEIHFSRRPDDVALQPLRDDRRWRYTGFSRCWYARQSPELTAWANDFVTRFNVAQTSRSVCPVSDPLVASVPLVPSLNGDTTPVSSTGPQPHEREVVSPAILL
jgi:hypothetical protein